MALRKMIKTIANKVPYTATLADYGRFRLTSGAVRDVDDERSKAVLDQLSERGFVIIPDYWSKDDCAETVADMERLFVDYPQHVRRYSDVRIFGAEELSERIDRFYSDPFLQMLSDRYTGAYTVNAFTLANKVEVRSESKGSGEGWHKDSSFRQFKAFIYLNDVDVDAGPLELLAGSHRIDAYLKDMRAAQLPFRQLRMTDEQIEEMLRLEPSRRVPMVGAAGTLIIADTACVHRGRPPVNGVRYALTNYYVEPKEIELAYLDAYHPVNPDKVLRLAASRGEPR
jgi:hypothetical protein